jgi:hypothetical protein
MKMLMVVTDVEFAPECGRALHDHGVGGYTLLPEVFGAGRTGEKLGDRSHPGASSMLIAVVDDALAQKALHTVRDCAAAHTPPMSIHAWIVPVEASLNGSAP